MNTQKLRDMNLHAVADELERLREFKAAVEKQEPEFDKKLFDSECRASVAGALGFQRGGDYAWSYLLAQIKEVVEAAAMLTASPALDHSDDKPAVAVPDGHKVMPKQVTEEMEEVFWREWYKITPDNVLTRMYNALYDAAPSHSQQSEPSTNVWESALLDAANAVVHANQNNTGYEPSRSLLACRIDDLREILDDANIDFPGDTDRCPSHESKQGE